MQISSITAVPSRGSRQGTAPQVPRTRTGCWACRDRSVKCDETKPQCRKCEKLGLSCRYGVRLQWIEDSEERGICHGREGVWSSKQTSQRKRPPKSSPLSPPASRKSLRIARTSDPTSPTFFLNTFSEDVQHYYIVNCSRSAYSQGGTCPAVGSFLDSKTYEDQKDDSEYPCVAPHGGSRRRGSQPEDPLGAMDVGSSLGFCSSVPMMLNPTGLSICLDEEDEYILQFYINVVCSTATILDDELHNPQRYVLIPMTSSSERVLAAVLAIGATKLAYNDSRYRQRALFHRHQVISNLSGLLQDINTDPIRYLEALASTMILCWSDITNLCRSSWTHHLMGLSGILETCPETAYLDPHGARLIQTCQQYLVYHLIMARATFCVNDIIPNATEILSKYVGEDETSSRLGDGEHRGTAHGNDGSDNLSTLPQLLSPSTLRNMHHVDPHQGFSNSLLVLINEICDLADASERGERAQDAIEIAKRVRHLETQLENLTQILPRPGSLSSDSTYFAHGSFSTNAEPPKHRMVSIMNTAEAHRLAALLFLDETCALHIPHVVPDCRAARAAHTEAILSLVESICEKEPVTAALPIWPVFIVGCATVTDEDRLRVLNILDQFQCRRIFGSIPPACAVIENVWRQRDLSSDENPRKALPALSMFGPHSMRQGALQSDNGSKKRGRPRRRLSGQRGAVEARYPWEPAMSMLGGSILSLT